MSSESEYFRDLRKNEFNPDFYKKETYRRESVPSLWVREMTTFHTEYANIKTDRRYAINFDLKIGLFLNGFSYAPGKDTMKKNKTKVTCEYRRGIDKMRYYIGIEDTKKAISHFFTNFPDFMLLIDVSTLDHNGAMCIYKRDGVYKFIAFNPNWDEVFLRFEQLAKIMFPRCPGFYMMCRLESNLDALCRKYSYDFLRDVMDGKIKPLTAKKTHWYCLGSRKRIYNKLTYPDYRIFYPRYNTLVIHGKNKSGKSCPAKEDGSCNNCDFVDLSEGRYDLKHCPWCDDLVHSAMFSQ